MTVTQTDQGGDDVVANERLALASGAALLAAGLILVLVVLPAEYGVDPLGVGRMLGMTALTRPGRADITMMRDERMSASSME